MLLDTAGRYTTQDPSDYRRCGLASVSGPPAQAPQPPPLNGVMVALSARISWTRASRPPATRRGHQRRLSELTGRLRISLPVYVMVTKLDLIPDSTNSSPTSTGAPGAGVGNDLPDPCPEPAREGASSRRSLSVDRAPAHALPAATGGRNPRPEPRTRIFAFPNQVAARASRWNTHQRRLASSDPPRRDAARRVFHQRHPGRNPDRPSDGGAGA